jgi:hypothetical protein
MLKHLSSIAAFMIVSFAVQGLSHFVINVDHFAAVGFLRPDPIIPLGLATMVIQGLIMSLALASWRGNQTTIRHGLMLAWAFGAFLVSYIAIVEPSKYLVPSITSWVTVELVAGLIQFTLFGLLLGFIHLRVK